MRHLLLIALLSTAAPSFAQSPASSADPWAPWIGCWQISEESVEDAEKLLSALTGTPAAPAQSRARVCVAASPEGGATLTTLVSGKAVQTETVVADAKPRPVTEAGCQGTQQAEWSQHGARIYARTEISCADQPKRTISGFSAIVNGPVWVDIQLIESGGRKSMRVRRYRPTADQPASARSTRSTPVGGKLTLAEIKEASSKLAPEAVQAAVMELGSGGYDLNASRLIELDDAGVHDSVIDLMVAMSFPRKFVVERASGGGSYGGGSYGGVSPYDFGYTDAWGYGLPWGYYAHPAYYASYYSPFGYNRWGYYDPYYYQTPGVVIINPGGGNGDIASTGNGRVVDGQGYTRIRPNVPEPAIRTGGNTGGWGGASAGTSSGSTSGSNSGGSVSTGGYSGGGGGERVAVPRPPGGSN